MTAGQDIPIGMGEYAIAFRPGERLTMILGSCVGVFLWDRSAKVAAALHAMLPEAPPNSDAPARYVDSGVPILLDAAIKAGASRGRLEAKIFGGANMFPKLARTFIAHLGTRNVEAARCALRAIGVLIVAEDLGGTAGRVATIDAESGAVEIRLGDSRRRI